MDNDTLAAARPAPVPVRRVALRITLELRVEVTAADAGALLPAPPAEKAAEDRANFALGD